MNTQVLDHIAFKEERERLGVTVRELSARTDILTWDIRRIERGKASLQGIRFHKLKDTLAEIKQERGEQ